MQASQPVIIGFIVVLLIPLWVLLARHFEKGIAYAVFLCVSMTTFLRIEMPGNLPQLTIYRLILVSLAVAWFWCAPTRGRLSQTLFFRPLCFWVAASFLSLLFTSVDFVTSLKRFLDLVFEVWVFYLLLATTLHQREDVVRVLRAAWLGMTLVALLAVLERYTRFNPVHWLVSEEAGRDVVSTYQHRILLGTGMVMAYPLAFGLMQWSRAVAPRRLWLWASVMLFLAASYFSQSRGPWLAAILVGGVLMFGADRAIRSRLVGIGLLAMMVLLLRPGVFDTLSDRVDASFDSQSFKGGTLLYRIELWKVAWNQVSQSPLRLLVGYGPGCGSKMDIEWNLSYRDQEYDISSWDNQFAYDLFQSGLLGLCASFVLYFSVLKFLYRQWRRAVPPDKEVILCLFASTLALVFMMTNVMIFVKQLNFLFWTVVTTGCVLGRDHASDDSEEQPVHSDLESTEELETCA